MESIEIDGYYQHAVNVPLRLEVQFRLLSTNYVLSVYRMGEAWRLPVAALLAVGSIPIRSLRALSMQIHTYLDS